jgi:hypothetical protein
VIASSRHSLPVLGIVILLAAALVAVATPAAAQDRVLTVPVLVNSANTTGYNTTPTSPGEFQRFAERYLEFLQVPYEIVDVSNTAPLANLTSRQLIIAGHSGLNLSSAWQTAIRDAVNGGVGFVNLDYALSIGSQLHIQAIFGASGATSGTPGTTISVPAAVRPGGAAAHFVTAQQVAFAGDTVNQTGDLVYNYHPDTTGVVRTSTSTLLTGATGTILARLGSDPLIRTGALGAGRAVHFGTLDYLHADRFGFMQGVDDLFWRSLAFAARKPFVIRAYPRFWTVQMDDTEIGWGQRVPDLYNPAFTGPVNPDGTGGPWKVTGYLFTRNLVQGGAERASVVTDIKAGKLKVVPHSLSGVQYGNLYWNGTAGRALTDAEWLANLNEVVSWKQGNGGNDTIPSFSRSLVGHFWDISDNIGYDIFNTFGIRYMTAIQRPGFQNCFTTCSSNGPERLQNPRPFWLYEKPPKTVRDENFSFYFADDYPINSRAGLPSQNFFMFTTQLQDPDFYPRPDAIWPSSQFTLTDSIEQWQRYTWRFWSSLAPVQIYTHDSSNYQISLPSDRQPMIQAVSNFLNHNGARHVFMDELGDYIRARTKSRLTGVQLVGSNLVYTYTGSATSADNVPVPTEVMIFYDNSSEGVYDTLQGFTNGANFTQALPPPPPSIASITPSSGPTTGGTTVTISGGNFVGVSSVLIGGTPVSGLVVQSTSTISATTPPGTTGPADVVVITASGTSTLLAGYTYLGPPTIDKVNPNFGPAAGGTVVTIVGRGLESTSTVAFNGVLASSVTLVDAQTLNATTPPGPAGPVNVTVSNSHGSTVAQSAFVYFSGNDVLHMDFSYGSRSALLAAGWDFIARTAAGASRDTEQRTGLTVSYDQVSHPGTIRIPADTGDIYQDLNSSRNTLFFTLPDGWRSLRMKVKNFSPTGNYQMAGLIAYQDDNNYVAINRYFSSSVTGNHVFEFAVEQAGLYAATSQRSAPTSGAYWLRLDRGTGDVFTAFVSADGVNWTPMAGTITITLENPRVGVLVGGNESGSPVPNADIEFVEAVVIDAVPVLDVSPTSLAFSAAVGTSPAPSTLTISNTGGGNLNWSATDSASWLTLSPASGIATATTPSTLTATVDTTGLAAGTYSTSIVVSASGASGSPKTIPVTLTVTPPAPPTVTGVSPSLGPDSGGTTVTVSGGGFVAGTTVTFGGTAATSVTITNGTTLTAVTAAHVAGSVNVVVSNANGTATLSGGFTYTAPGTVLMSDDFNDGDLNGWLISPLGNLAGWSVVSGALKYNGGGHTQLYRGDVNWTDYTFELSVRLGTLSNWPGGIRGRVDPTTGAGYAVWMYPGTSQLVLFRVTGWNIDTAGLTTLATAPMTFDTNAHRLRLSFQGTQIGVYWDGVQVLSATDSTRTNGVIALDTSNQPVTYDDVSVVFGSPAAIPILSVSPSGLGFTAAVGVNPPAQSLTITNVGQGTLTWQATDDSTWLSVTPASGTAPSTLTVNVNVAGLAQGTYQGSISITAPGATGSPQGIGVSLTVTAAVAPTVTAVSPALGPSGGGTSVTITGSGFVAGTTVTFGGTAATNVTLTSGTSLTAVTPAHAAGPVNVVVSNANGTATLAGGFTYTAPGTVLLSDNFNDGNFDGWLISPLGHLAGWSVANGGLTYNGGGHTQLYRGDVNWTDYTFEVSVRLSTLTNWPGGIRGRVNPSTGAGYAVWMYPGSSQIVLFRVTGWNIDTPGLAQLGAAPLAFDATSVHRLRLAFQGTQIRVFWDGVLVLSATDSTNANGVIALDVSNQPVTYDDVSVVFGSPLAVSGLAPTFGPVTGGTSVTMTGTGFTSGTTVTFGGTAATSVTVASDTSLTAVTPAQVAGAADVVVSNTNGTATLPGAFTFATSGTLLLSDDFNDGNFNGWTVSPLGFAAGWSVVNGVLNYNGGGHTQLYRGDAAWTDYTFDTTVRLVTGSNFPGGIRARVNPTTGAGYAVWLYPASGQVVLYRATGWNIDSPGLTQLAAAGGVALNTSPHALRITVRGSQISVSWDGVQLMSVTDATYSSGVVAMDVANQPITFDDVAVRFAP